MAIRHASVSLLVFTFKSGGQGTYGGVRAPLVTRETATMSSSENDRLLAVF